MVGIPTYIIPDEWESSDLELEHEENLGTLEINIMDLADGDTQSEDIKFVVTRVVRTF